MAIHAMIKTGRTHAVVEQINGVPQMDETGANLIEDDGDTAWFSWDDFTLIADPVEYASEVNAIRLFDEGDGWAIDGADNEGHYTEAVFKYDTLEEATSHVPAFLEELVRQGIEYKNLQV